MANELYITELIKGAPILTESDTVRRAASLIRASAGSAACVHSFGRIVGFITESSIAKLLAESDDIENVLDNPVAPIIDGSIEFINPHMHANEAAKVFAQTGADVLPVVDQFGAFAGVLYRTDLVALLTHNLRPPTVGGMATPLGVFLTTGSHTSGAGNLGLFLTGVSMMILIVTASITAFGLMAAFGGISGINIIAYLRSAPIPNIPNVYDLPSYIQMALTSVFTMLFLRLSPLSGYHAAEHMTVHAIEAGETLTPETVARMPRVHPRCGTNLLAGASLLIIITAGLNSEIAVLIALVVVVLGWRQVGGWLQSVVTTKNPTANQLASGVAAGIEILSEYQKRPNHIAVGIERIWNIGFIQTAAGMMAAYLILEQLSKLLPFPTIFS